MEERQKKKLIWQIPFLILLIVGTVLIVRQQHSQPYQQSSDFIFGTAYKIVYQHDEDLSKEIREELMKVDFSLSPFNEKSVITAVNQNRDVALDPLFLDVFTKAMEISRETDGAFDITVAPLVNAWGFGFKNETRPTPLQVDSLLQIVGYKKIKLEDGKVVKQDPRMMLDCSAIAKGYGVDVVARYLRSQGIQNFMVEIGGEVVTSGVNPQRLPWRVGVVKPSEDSLNVGHELQTVLNVTDKAMATSGNYRNFYYKNGKRFPKVPCAECFRCPPQKRSVFPKAISNGAPPVAVLAQHHIWWRMILHGAKIGRVKAHGVSPGISTILSAMSI